MLLKQILALVSQPLGNRGQKGELGRGRRRQRAVTRRGQSLDAPTKVLSGKLVGGMEINFTYLLMLTHLAACPKCVKEMTLQLLNFLIK